VAVTLLELEAPLVAVTWLGVELIEGMGQQGLALWLGFCAAPAPEIKGCHISSDAAALHQFSPMAGGKVRRALAFGG
jgi:hypothetical protein